MQKICLTLSAIGLLLALSACESSRVELLKSPCTGIEDSPCGPKRPVNEWWMSGQGSSEA